MTRAAIALSIAAWWILAAFSAAPARAATDCELFVTVNLDEAPSTPWPLTVSMVAPAASRQASLTFSEPTRAFENHYGYATIAERAERGLRYMIDLESVPGTDVNWKLLFLIDHPTGKAIVVDATVPDTSCTATATIPTNQLPQTATAPSDPSPTSPYPLAIAAVAGALIWLRRARRLSERR